MEMNAGIRSLQWLTRAGNSWAFGAAPQRWRTPTPAVAPEPRGSRGPEGRRRRREEAAQPYGSNSPASARDTHTEHWSRIPACVFLILETQKGRFWRFTSCPAKSRASLPVSHKSLSSAVSAGFEMCTRHGARDPSGPSEQAHPLPTQGKGYDHPLQRL